MATSELVRVVRSVLCRNLTADQAVELASATRPVSVAAGDLVFREGEKSSGLLIFVRGTAEVVKQAADGTSHPITSVEAPSVLGEMGLLTERPRSATVRAVSACQFHLLTKMQFERMMREERLAAYKLLATIADVLARRVEAMDARLVALATPDPGPPREELEQLREKLFTDWSY